MEESVNERIARLLNRGTDLTALSSLIQALDSKSSTSGSSDDYSDTIIALDTNILLRLSGHRRSADVIDFLRTNFGGRLILPGQVIQEFWNNQTSAMEPIAAKIRSQLENLKREVEKIDETYGEFAKRFKTTIDDFQNDFGYLYDEVTSRRLRQLLDLLSEKALVPFCNRNDLVGTALARRRTKTPPGFKDEEDGDFFVWADLLLGIATLEQQGFIPKQVFFVTNDVKIDWVRGGVPHPILSAEIAAFCGAAFHIWTLEELVKIVPS